jgi:folate-binding protein YgfZ
MSLLEYDAAYSSAILIDRTDRAVLRVYGRDPVKMIQGLITNDLAGASRVSAVYAAVLTPKGRMVADVRALQCGADVWLEVDASAREPLAAHLRKFVPPLFARFEHMADLAVVGVYGPDSARVSANVLGASAQTLAEDQLAVHAWHEGEIVAIGTALGVDLIVRAPEAHSLRDALKAAGATPAGADTLETLRIEAGSPRWGAELDENVIPLEAGLRERAISQTKGCYTGQEVIVRILHRGHVNWLLRGVLLGAAAIPARGDTLVRAEDGKAVGRITSACHSPRFGQTIALAYVRREIEPGSSLVLGAAARATIVELPFAGPREPVRA